MDETELCSVQLETPLTTLSFNPLNWRQVCGSNEGGLYIWNIDQVNESYHLLTRYVFLFIYLFILFKVCQECTMVFQDYALMYL